ncbi:formyltransferase family protein [Streptomyces coacervatus]|uniref:formyltransferase family protein n=1 Tax=Streptomyces coacervatus TaxID=647381 RepID=UPI0023D98ECE|nr:formyltransferase family protein [Streptomyces coacervatus]MDF2273418.1 formyltransferase family protein [Streptomyces coacervatus]
MRDHHAFCPSCRFVRPVHLPAAGGLFVRLTRYVDVVRDAQSGGGSDSRLGAADRGGGGSAEALHGAEAASGGWPDLEPGRCDLVVSVLYDQIIGKELIDATDTIVNCHPGRLPQYRGARPVNWALHNGEPLHGATLHVIETGIDTGPILGEVTFSIWPDTDEVRDVWQRTMRHAALLLSDTLPRLDQITPYPQDEALAVTHYLRDNHQLGSRSNWTRATSTSP